jgi:hypothetical protein
MVICNFWGSIVKSKPKLDVNFQKLCQEGLLGPWVHRLNYSVFEGRKKLDNPGLTNQSLPQRFRRLEQLLIRKVYPQILPIHIHDRLPILFDFT